MGYKDAGDGRMVESTGLEIAQTRLNSTDMD